MHRSRIMAEKIITLSDAVRALNGGQKGFSVSDDGTVEYAKIAYSKEDLSKIEIDTSSFIVPSKEDVLAKFEELKSANQYKIDREGQYPNIGDQLDDLYKQGAFSDEMAAKIKKVKDDNPKPS